MEKRKYVRVEVKSIIVSLTDPVHDQEITGFLRDISEGGMKIQKMSAKRQIELGEYNTQFMLPGYGMIIGTVQVLGFGNENEKFGGHLIRMQFVNLDIESKLKIRDYVIQHKQPN